MKQPTDVIKYVCSIALYHFGGSGLEHFSILYHVTIYQCLNEQFELFEYSNSWVPNSGIRYSIRSDLVFFQHFSILYHVTIYQCLNEQFELFEYSNSWVPNSGIRYSIRSDLGDRILFEYSNNRDQIPEQLEIAVFGLKYQFFNQKFQTFTNFLCHYIKYLGII